MAKIFYIYMTKYIFTRHFEIYVTKIVYVTSYKFICQYLYLHDNFICLYDKIYKCDRAK